MGEVAIISKVIMDVMGRGSAVGSGVMVSLMSAGVIAGSEAMVGVLTRLYKVAGLLIEVSIRFEVLSGSIR